MNPFEKEKRLPTRGMPRENDVGHRTRFHAHTLSARIFVSGENLLLVRGEPEPASLLECLFSEIPERTAPIDRLDPVQLGFRNTDIIPLSRPGLVSRSISLRKWRLSVEESFRGKASGVDRDRLRNELQVIESLGHRVSELHRIFDEPQNDGSPFWLEPAEEAALTGWFDRKLAGLHVNPEFRQLARIVCWMKGIEPLNRFITSFRDGFVSEAAWVQHRHLSHFVDLVSKIVERRQIYDKEIEERNARRAEELKSVFARRQIYSRLRQAAQGLAATREFDMRKFLPPDDAEIDFQELLHKCGNLASGGEDSNSIVSSRYVRIEVRQAIRAFEEVVQEALGLIDDVKSRLGPLELKDRAKFLSSIRSEGLIDDLRFYFESFPVSWKGPDRIHLPRRDTEIDFEKLRKRTKDIIFDESRKIPQEDHFRNVAFLAMSGGLPIPVSWPTIHRNLHYRRDCERFWNLSDRPGYTKLLEFMEETAESIVPEDSWHFLTTGGTSEDLHWLQAQELDHRIKDRRGSAAMPLRKISDWFKKHKSPLEEDDITSLWESLSSESTEIVVANLARFLGWLSRPSAQQVAEIRGLILLFDHPAFRLSFADRLRNWANPPSRTRLPAGIPGHLPTSITTPLRRLAFYQRMAGETARIPGSILRKIEARTRLDAEMRFLASLGDRRTESQSQRLDYISRKLEAPKEIDLETHSPLIRQLREVTVITALKAFKNVMRQELEAWWRQEFDFEPDLKKFRWTDLSALAGWAENLSAEERARVSEIMKAYRTHGSRYRHALPANSEWLARASRKIDVEAWSSPDPATFLMEDQQEIQLEVAVDPIDIFLMGSRFESCLSLDGGINSIAVIANAADANKAVVYAFRKDGTPCARKLVCVSRKWKLLGYAVHAHENREDFIRLFHRFCGQWAARAGLGLAKHGEPENLTGGFWYDDTPKQWSQNAIAAYREIRPDFEPNFREDGEPDLETLRRAIRASGSNRQEALEAIAATNSHWLDIAMFWKIRIGAIPEPIPNLPDHYDFHFGCRDLFQYLVATGELNVLTEPARFEVMSKNFGDYWAWISFTALNIIPSERNRIADAVNLISQLSAMKNDEDDRPHIYDFQPISPAFAALPFRDLVSLLILHGPWVEIDRQSHDSKSLESWTLVLEWAWRRDPDLIAFSEAIQDPSSFVQVVMKAFCETVKDRRFATPIRRQMRSSDHIARDPDWSAISKSLSGVILQKENGRFPQPDEAIVFDRSIAIEDRLDAVTRLTNSSEENRSTLGALLIIEWPKAEISQMPFEMRREFATAMAVQNKDEIWKTWPLLHWLGTLPMESQCEILLRANKTAMNKLYFHIDTPGHFTYLSWGVLSQALDHAEESIRKAAETVFRMTVRRAPSIRKQLVALHEKWIWPDTCDRLIETLEAEANS